MMFKVTIHTDLTSLPAEWPVGSAHEVCAPGHHVFQTRTFLDLWADTFGQDPSITLCLVEVRDGSRSPVLFIPFCIQTRHGFRVLGFMDAHVSDYNAPVLFPIGREWSISEAQDLWRQIDAALPPYDLMRIDKMPAAVDGIVNPLALIADGPNDVFCHGNDLHQPFAEIDAGWPQRRTFLKKMRGLERAGDFAFRMAETEAERARVIEKLLVQKQRRFEETKVPGFETAPEKHAFFLRGTTVFAGTGTLYLSYIEVNGEIIATLWGLANGLHYYALMIGFDGGEWAQYSTGRIVYYRTLEWLHKNGFEFMDLGIGNEPWKLEHCRTTIPLFMTTRARTWKGRLLLRQEQVMTSLRATKTWQRLRPLKWVFLRGLRQWRNTSDKTDHPPLEKP